MAEMFSFANGFRTKLSAVLPLEQYCLFFVDGGKLPFYF